MRRIPLPHSCYAPHPAGLVLDLGAILSDVADAHLPPPSARSLMEFARALTLPDGPYAGQLYEPATEPAQRLALEEMDTGRWRTFIHCAPSQRGKTLIGILIPTMRAICDQRQSVGYVLPTLDKLAQVYSTKFRPMLERSGFAEWLPQEGPGSRGGRPAVLPLRDPARGRVIAGNVVFMASGTGARETAVASVSVPNLVIDEADDFASAGQVVLALKRIAAYGTRGRAAVTSTVNDRTDRSTHPILELVAQGSQARIHHRCPHCESYAPAEWEHVSEDGRYVCPGCAVVWSDADRAAALDAALLVHAGQAVTAGRVVGEPDAPGLPGAFSLLTTGLDYHMGSLAAMVAEHRAAAEAEAKGDQSLMRTFQHKTLCRAYEAKAAGGSVTAAALALRSATSSYRRGELPPDCARWVASIDIQRDRCYWLAIGELPGNRFAILDGGEAFWTRRDEDPTDEKRRPVLDGLLARFREGLPGDGGRLIPAALVGVDVGYETRSIAGWIAGKAGVIPVRGDDRAGSRAVDAAGRKQGQEAALAQTAEAVALNHFAQVRTLTAPAPGEPPRWVFVRSQSGRETVSRGLNAAAGESGAILLPQGLAASDDVIRHLSAWRIELEAATGAAVWVQHGRRDDYNDCAIYDLALLSIKPRPASRRYGAVGKVGG